MGKVTSGIQAHAQDGVARLQQRQEYRLIGGSAAMRLHIGELAAEQQLGALNRQVLGNVDMDAAAVIAPPRIAFGIFVGQHASPAPPSTAAETTFSLAINSMPFCWRTSSAPIAGGEFPGLSRPVERQVPP